MTGQEIKRLAKEYADSLDYVVVSRPTTADIVTDALRYILRTHCIVGKKKVKALCRLTIENSISVDYALIDGLTDLVCDMFSDEYHKEMDNE